MSARTTLAGAFVAALLCGVLVAGCSGGGGGTSTPSVASGPAAPANGPAAGSNAAGSSKTAQVTIRVTIPTKSTSSKARSPLYVSPNTVAVYVLANGTYVGQFACAPGVCSGSVPVPLTTTSLTIELVDSSEAVLSQATQAVIITPGVANTFTFTFDGVAATLAVTAPTTTELVATGAVTNFPIVVTPEDISGAPIVAPGNVIDAAGNVLISAGGTTQTVTLTSSSPHLAISALTWNPTTYTLSGTATYDGIDPMLTPDTISLTPSTTVDPTFAGALVLNVLPPAMFIGPDPANPPVGYAVTIGTPTPFGGATATNATIELPLATTVATPIHLLLYTNFTPAAGSDVSVAYDDCTNNESAGHTVGNAFPAPVPYTAAIPFAIQAFAAAATSCEFSLSLSGQTTPITANASIFFNQPSLIIQGKNRK